MCIVMIYCVLWCIVYGIWYGDTCRLVDMPPWWVGWTRKWADSWMHWTTWTCGRTWPSCSRATMVRPSVSTTSILFVVWVEYQYQCHAQTEPYTPYMIGSWSTLVYSYLSLFCLNRDAQRWERKLDKVDAIRWICKWFRTFLFCYHVGVNAAFCILHNIMQLYRLMTVLCLCFIKLLRSERKFKYNNLFSTCLFCFLLTLYLIETSILILIIFGADSCSPPHRFSTQPIPRTALPSHRGAYWCAPHPHWLAAAAGEERVHATLLQGCENSVSPSSREVSRSCGARKTETDTGE